MEMAVFERGAGCGHVLSHNGGAAAGELGMTEKRGLRSSDKMQA
jgi:hypothetical protein